MKLHVLGSNSLGNCYILCASNNESLLLEAGIHLSEIKQTVGFDIKSIAGCIISHEHGDHFKYIDQVASMGIKIYASKGTLATKSGHRFIRISAGIPFNIKSFKILPFLVKHDAREPFGFLINHPECGNVLFLTDTAQIKYKFPRLNQIILEANHSRQLVNDKLIEGRFNPAAYRRLVANHMSIETAEQLLEANDLSGVVNIVLIHLSDSNSLESEFKNRIKLKTGKPVQIATKKTVIDLSLSKF